MKYTVVPVSKFIYTVILSIFGGILILAWHIGASLWNFKPYFDFSYKTNGNEPFFASCYAKEFEFKSYQSGSFVGYYEKRTFKSYIHYMWGIEWQRKNSAT